MVFRIRKREIFSAAALLFLIILTFTTSTGRPRTLHREHGKNAPITGGHPYVKPTPLQWATPFPTLTSANWNATQTPPALLEDNKADGPDRALVVAKLEGEDTRWLRSSFPYWKIAEYTIPSGFAELHQSRDVVDKGRIANAYLTYLIENYYNLPSTIVFLTPHRNAARDSTENQNFISLGQYPLLQSLNIAHVQKMGYVNLRCTASSVCLTTILPFRSSPNEYRTLEVAMSKAWTQLFPSTPVPEKLAAPCCAEFAVSRGQVKKRGLDQYRRFWEWLNKTKMDDETAGLVLEALWHVIFGRPAMDCEEGDVSGLGNCECDVYGKC